MLIKEAIKMLQRMDQNEEVFLQFKEDVTEDRNNEKLRKQIRENDEILKRFDTRDLYYRQVRS
jgi:hypothetical protein